MDGRGLSSASEAIRTVKAKSSAVSAATFSGQKTSGDPMPPHDAGAYVLGALALAAVVVLGATVLFAFDRRRPKHKSLVRKWLLRPELSGGLGSALALLIAAEPSLVTGPMQAVVLVFAVVFVLWFIPAFFINVAKEERRNRARLSRNAISWAHDVTNLIRDVKSFQVIGLDAAIIDKERREAQLQYFRYFRFRVIHFLAELSDEFESPELTEAVNLSNKMAISYDPAIEDIEHLGEYLAVISDDILR
jgi:hypothetical protein